MTKSMPDICRESDYCAGYLSDNDRGRKRAMPRIDRRPTLFVSHSLESDCLDALKNKARLAVVIGKLWKLKILTRELFDLKNIEFEVDPDEPDQHFLIFNVSAVGDVKEIASRRREWHRKIDGFLDRDRGYVRLLIDVQ